MIFLSLLFLVIALIVLIKGHLMNEMVNNLNVFLMDYKDKVSSLTTEEQLNTIFKIVYIFGFQILHIILWIVFLVKAVSVDIYLYPTIIMIVIFIVTILYAVVKYERNKKLKDEFKGKPLATRSSWRTIEAIIEIIYISYLLWLLLF